jgi:hypothetical protein
MLRLRQGRMLCLLAVFALTGCGTARVVTRDFDGGVVAIPENSNSWPYYYRDKAKELIKEDCPDGQYVIAKEEEVTIGTVTTEHTPSDSAHTTETRNRTEYRIYYKKASPPRTVVVPPLRRVSVASLQPVAPAPPASTLPPQPTPVTSLPREPIPATQQ